MPGIGRQNVRKVTFSAYVLEDEADIIDADLNNVAMNCDATLSGITVTIETVSEDDEPATYALEYFREMFRDCYDPSADL